MLAPALYWSYGPYRSHTGEKACISYYLTSRDLRLWSNHRPDFPPVAIYFFIRFLIGQDNQWTHLIKITSALRNATPSETLFTFVARHLISWYRLKNSWVVFSSNSSFLGAFPQRLVYEERSRLTDNKEQVFDEWVFFYYYYYCFFTPLSCLSLSFLSLFLKIVRHDSNIADCAVKTHSVSGTSNFCCPGKYIRMGGNSPLFWTSDPSK